MMTEEQHAGLATVPVRVPLRLQVKFQRERWTIHTQRCSVSGSPGPLRSGTMQILVFVSDDGTPAGSGPILFLKSRPDASLPPHPRSLEWRYFATIADGDALLGDEREHILAALSDDGFYIAQRLI